MYSSKIISASLIVCALTGTLLTACGNKKDTAAKTETKTTEAKATPPSGKIAYVNMDTLESKYEYLKNKRAELEKETAQLDAEIGRMTQSFQNEYVAFQKKAQAGTLTQAEGEAGQKRLGEMQQNIEMRQKNAGAQLMKKQDAFNKDLQSRLDTYLAKYNAEKNYDYILSYTKGGPIMFANKALDITEEVVKGMNAESSASATDNAESK
jgi:outer membrane protein